MLFVSRLSLDEQATILVSSLAEHGAVLPRKRAAQLCVELAGRDEKAAAKWLRERLAEIGITIKHTHALRFLGLLTGRAGWHDPSGDARGGFHLMSVGLAAPEERHGHDVHELLGELCKALARWAKGIQRPAVVTLRRGAHELMVDHSVASDEGFVATLRAVGNDHDWPRWIELQNHAVEHVRRALEEGQAPVFVDGAVLAMLPSAKSKGVREIAVYEHAYEVGRGTPLHALELMEKEAGEELLDARADSNFVRTAKHSFALMEVHRSFERNFEWNERTLLNPETERLLRQYRMFRRKVGPLVPLQLSGRYFPADGAPERVPVNWVAVETARERAGLTHAAIAQQTNSTAIGEAVMKRSDDVSLGEFVELAGALKVENFDELVRRPTWRTAQAAGEGALRTALYAVDDLRFMFSGDFGEPVQAAIREAAETLHASRKVRQMQLAGMVDPPLDELVFAQDADEFLAAIAEYTVEVRMQITPCFISPKALGLTEDMLPGAKDMLPGVGRRLTVLLRSRQLAERS